MGIGTIEITYCFFSLQITQYITVITILTVKKVEQYNMCNEYNDIIYYV